MTEALAAFGSLGRKVAHTQTAYFTTHHAPRTPLTKEKRTNDPWDDERKSPTKSSPASQTHKPLHPQGSEEGNSCANGVRAAQVPLQALTRLASGSEIF